MDSSNKWSAILNVIATILSWTAYGLGIASVTSNGWIYFSSSNIISQGLWRECFIGNICLNVSTVDPWLHAVRAFIIMMVVFTFLANLLNIVSQWKLNKKAREGSGSIWMMSAFFGVIGASVYTSFASQLYSSSGFVYGHGYIFAWISVGLLFIANPCNYFSARKMSENCQV